MEFQSEQCCAIGIKWCVQNHNALCYGVKCWNMLKIQRLRAETCSKYRWYVQMQKCSYVCVFKGRNLHTAAEMFIHVAIQNFTTWLLYIVLRITAGQQTITIDSVVCPITLDIRSNNLKFTVLVIMSIQLSWRIMSTAYWCNENKIYLFPSWQSVWSECIYQTSKLVSFDISIVSIFIPFYVCVSAWWHLSIFENFEKNTCQHCNVILA